jgi:hypothetical protein
MEQAKITHQLPCKALIPDHSMADLLVDKSKMTDILKDLDIVPPSVTFSRDIEDFTAVFDKLKGNFGCAARAVQADWGR